MKANAVPLLAILEKKLRLEVTLFQRQHIWNRSHQWEPLWEDICRMFSDYFDGIIKHRFTSLVQFASLFASM